MLSLLDMSLAGGAVILAVLLIRALALDRLPKGVFTALWTVAVLRLLVPVSLPSPVSLWAGVRAIQAVSAEATPAGETRLDVPAAMGMPAPAGQPVTVPAADEGPAPAPSVNSPAEDAPAAASGRPIPWRPVIWAAGALGVGAFFTVGYTRGRRKFREAVEVQDDFIRRWQEGHPTRRRVSVRLSGRVSSPMTYGLLRPVVLLPAGTDFHDERALGFILAHEYSHIRRLDGLKKLILAAAACVHWFNPLVWAMFFLAGRDMEMACDEAVVRSLDGPGRAAYARTLIRMEEVKAGLPPLASHFSANAMEERITAIMKMKKWTALAVVICIMLTAGVTAVFASSAPREAPPSPAPAANPVPYDGWGHGRAYVLLPEELLETVFPGADIQWWEQERFAAWMEDQEPLLDNALGSESWSAAAGDFVWTEDGAEAVMGAYGEVLASIKNGALVSENVNGREDGSVVVAVDPETGPSEGVTVCDLEMMQALLGRGDGDDSSLNGPAYDYDMTLPDGTPVHFRRSQTEMGLLQTVKAFLDAVVEAGTMTQDQEDGVFIELLADQDNIPLERFVSKLPEPAQEPAAAEASAGQMASILDEAARGQVLFPLTEDGLAELFGGVDIRWWAPGEFAAWAAAQRPLLEATVGGPSPESVANGELTWTAERTEAVMAALEDIGAALENGTGRLSRTVAGRGEVVLAVGIDLGLEAGAQGYDMDQLLWCGTNFTGSHTCDVGIGQRLVVLGPSGTEMGLFRLMYAYYDTMVNAGVMDAGTANISLHRHWDAYQHGEMPDQWLVGGEGTAVLKQEPWYVRAKPRYVWDLTGEEPMVREENSEEEADYLLDIRPYGFRTPVNFDYVGLSGSNFSVHLPPGEESTVDSYDGQIDYLVIARSGGSFDLIQRALNGGEERSESFTEEAGGAVARRTGWYVEGGMELVIRNTGTEPLVIDGFIYR